MESVSNTNSEASNLKTKDESPVKCESTGDDCSAEPIEPNNVSFKIVFNKQKLDITWNANENVSKLKTHIHKLTNVPPAMQKLMFKGLVKDDQSLSEIGVTNGSKMMLVGSKLNDVISVNTKVTDEVSASKSTSKKKDPLCKQKPHLKICEQGVPEDALPGYKNGHEPLPNVPLKNMVNKYGHKVRLTFKLEADQVWISTKERTQKVSMSSIKDVISEPIDGHEEYHMLGLQLGTTEQSRYWVYWVPAQYINAIKEIVLGKFY